VKVEGSSAASSTHAPSRSYSNGIARNIL
jgi:hypothetical protein